MATLREAADPSLTWLVYYGGLFARKIHTEEMQDMNDEGLILVK